MAHLVVKFTISAFLRTLLSIYLKEARVLLPWGENLRRVAPTGKSRCVHIYQVLVRCFLSHVGVIFKAPFPSPCLPQNALFLPFFSNISNPWTPRFWWNYVSPLPRGDIVFVFSVCPSICLSQNLVHISPPIYI